MPGEKGLHEGVQLKIVTGGRPALARPRASLRALALVRPFGPHAARRADRVFGGCSAANFYCRQPPTAEGRAPAIPAIPEKALP